MSNEIDVWQLSDLETAHLNEDRPEPTDENLLSMLGQLKDIWIPEDEPEANEILEWGARRMDFDGIESVTFNELERKTLAKTFSIVNLHNMISASKNLKEEVSLKDDIFRICDCIRRTREVVHAAKILYNTASTTNHNVMPDDANIESIINYDKQKLNTLQSLLIHFTSKLKLQEYRKFGDECWHQIKSSEGYNTQAWKADVKPNSEEALKIIDFLYQVVRKEIDFDQWKNLTNPHNNAERVVEHLINSEESEFPSLTVDRNKWSYDNGIYCVDTDTFWKYEEEDYWYEQATAIQNYRRSIGWGNDYTVVPPSSKEMTVKYFPQKFRFTIDPETEKSFNAHEIVLVELDKVLNTQNLTEDTKEWVLKMLARLFFKLGDKDKWQVVFFIKGVAGSGKSTLANLIRYMYPPSLVTTLSSNVEAKFGLSAIYKGLICVCSEVAEDFGLDQRDWQSAASGEELSIAIKNKTAISHKWTTPFFFLGNEIMNYKNASGSVDRRLFLIEFNFKVRGSDPHLFTKIVNDIDLFHRKSVSLYLEEVRKNGDKDIWCPAPSLLPQQIYDFKTNMRLRVDPLYCFLQSGVFDFDEEHQMSVSDFKEAYTAFRKENGLGGCKWNSDHYASIFTEIGIVLQKDMVQGVRFKDTETDS